MSAALCATLLAVSACGGGGGSDRADDADGTSTLRVGILPIVHTAPVILGMKQGFFEEEGINIEVDYASTSAAIVPSIMSGDLDIGYGNLTSTILARTQRIPIVSIASADASSLDPESDTNAVIVKADSPYQTAEDLEGSRVAINALQASNYLTVRASADELGADSSQYEFVEVPFPDMLSSLAADRVDAANVTEPFFTQARESGDYRILYYTLNIAGTRPGFVSDSYFTSEEVLKNKGDAVAGFQRAIQRSKQYAQDNPDEVRAALPEYTQIPAAVLPDVTLPHWPSEAIPREDIDYMLQLMQDYDVLQEDPPSYEDIVQE